MKILALGGCGDMGRMAVAVLLNSPKITSITVTDLYLEEAEKYVKKVGSNKLIAAQIDVTNRKELVKLMGAHDIVVTTVGPYYKFGKMIFEAAIEAKKDYFDICDDWKPMLDILNLNDKAKNAGITAVIGIGASPGVSNLLAALACSKLDEVDDLKTGWGITLNEKRGKKIKYYVKKNTVSSNSAIEHLLIESIGKVPVFKNNKIIEIEPLTEAEPLNFPGFKNVYTYYIGHPEPVMLSRTIKAKSITNQLYLSKRATEIMRDFVHKIENKELTIEKAAEKLNKRLTRLVVNYLVLFWKFYKEFHKAPTTISVVATGTKNGKRLRIGAGVLHVPHGLMAGITGVPLAVAVLMFIDGKIQKKGALTPEEALDPMTFFEIYAKFCRPNLTAKDVLIIREETLT